MKMRRRLAFPLLLACVLACGGREEGTVGGRKEGTAVTVSGSALGAEGEILTAQVQRFMAENPGIRVEVQPTPDDATQRHQLYVQWLNAHVGSPDILQLDVVWTPELAAAEWILPLDRFVTADARADFFPATLAANTWRGRLFAIPWFVDVGMLYWRSDLLAAPPASLEELAAQARRAMAAPGGPARGIAWQGARYEGLITVFVEILGAFGGSILGPDGRIAVSSPEAVAALTYLRNQIESGVAPREVLTWHEEEARFAFQNGTTVFLRNWPYAWPLLDKPGESKVAGRFAVAPVPAAAAARHRGGRPSAALGGAQLAINAHSRHPEATWRLIAYLTSPAVMLERARAVGQYPARRSLFTDPRLSEALGLPADQVLRIVESALPRPVTPVYTELSGILQIHLHRALVGEVAPRAALEEAAREMTRVLDRAGLAPADD